MMPFMQVELTNGSYTIIDRMDWPLVTGKKLHILPGRATNYTGMYISGRGSVRLHRLILNAPPGRHVDHINHNGMDNRRCNLRIVSNRENLCLRRYRGVSKYNGVYAVAATVRATAAPRGLGSHIRIGRKMIHLGFFPFTPAGEVAAAKAYDRALFENFGLDHPLCFNFPEDYGLPPHPASHWQ